MAIRIDCVKHPLPLLAERRSSLRSAFGSVLSAAQRAVLVCSPLNHDGV